MEDLADVLNEVLALVRKADALTDEQWRRYNHHRGAGVTTVGWMKFCHELLIEQKRLIKALEEVTK